jgi:hypothetical protein
MGMENGPFSFALSVVNPSLAKSAIAMKKEEDITAKDRKSPSEARQPGFPGKHNRCHGCCQAAGLAAA